MTRSRGEKLPLGEHGWSCGVPSVRVLLGYHVWSICGVKGLFPPCAVSSLPAPCHRVHGPWSTTSSGCPGFFEIDSNPGTPVPVERGGSHADGRTLHHRRPSPSGAVWLPGHRSGRHPIGVPFSCGTRHGRTAFLYIAMSRCIPRGAPEAYKVTDLRPDLGRQFDPRRGEERGKTAGCRPSN